MCHLINKYNILSKHHVRSCVVQGLFPGRSNIPLKRIGESEVGCRRDKIFHEANALSLHISTPSHKWRLRGKMNLSSKNMRIFKNNSIQNHNLENYSVTRTYYFCIFQLVFNHKTQLFHNVQHRFIHEFLNM